MTSHIIFTETPVENVYISNIQKSENTILLAPEEALVSYRVLDFDTALLGAN